LSRARQALRLPVRVAFGDGESSLLRPLSRLGRRARGLRVRSEKGGTGPRDRQEAVALSRRRVSARSRQDETRRGALRADAPRRGGGGGAGAPHGAAGQHGVLSRRRADQNFAAVSRGGERKP